MMNTNSQSGQSLVEILVAMGIALLVVVALIRATAISLKGSGFSQTQARGTRYAQEAIEWIRGQRDEGWSILSLRTPSNLTDDYVYCLNDLSWPGTRGECSDYSLDSQYKREATLTNEGEGKIGVEVTVKWLEAGGERQSKLTTYFTNWRGGVGGATGTPAPTATLTPTPVPTSTPTPTPYVPPPTSTPTPPSVPTLTPTPTCVWRYQPCGTVEDCCRAGPQCMCSPTNGCLGPDCVPQP